MKDITNYKTPSPRTLENQQLVDDFIEFYCRFGKNAVGRRVTLQSPGPKRIQLLSTENVCKSHIRLAEASAIRNAILIDSSFKSTDAKG